MVYRFPIICSIIMNNITDNNRYYSCQTAWKEVIQDFNPFAQNKYNITISSSAPSNITCVKEPNFIHKLDNNKENDEDLNLSSKSQIQDLLDDDAPLSSCSWSFSSSNGNTTSSTTTQMTINSHHIDFLEYTLFTLSSRLDKIVEI